jgi:hypothetical protein
MEQGREASGRHGKRWTSQGSERAASAARTVERGKNPEDGTGEGLATLVLRGGEIRRGEKGHPAS